MPYRTRTIANIRLSNISDNNEEFNRLKIIDLEKAWIPSIGITLRNWENNKYGKMNYSEYYQN